MYSYARSIVLVALCFLASAATAIAEVGASGEGSATKEVQDMITNAWASSGMSAVVSGKVSQLVEAVQPVLPMLLTGALGAAAVACTLYCAYLYMDSEPYLFNKGKLGRLEARSIYVQKKSC